MRSISGRRSIIQLLLLTSILLILPLSALSLFALEGYQRHVGPELRQKAETVGRSVAARIERALSLGIPLDSLVGVDDYLGNIVDKADDLAFISLADESGRILHVAGLSRGDVSRLLTGEVITADSGSFSRIVGFFEPLIAVLMPGGERSAVDDLRGNYIVTTQPIQLGGDQVAELNVGVPLSFINRILDDIGFDIVIVLLAGVLLSFELLFLVISTNLNYPLGLARELMQDIRTGKTVRTIVCPLRNDVGRLVELLNAAVKHIHGRMTDAPALVQDRRQNLVVLRLLTFLFVFAEELARPFLPIYIEGFAATVSFADTSVLIGLPLSAFMLSAALSMAFIGPIFDSLDRRHTFLIGAIAGTAGLFGTALAQSYEQLVIWRMVSGFGYGVCFVACQGYVFDNTRKDDRAQGISMLVGGIITADICGPAIGGILADRIGFVSTLMLGGGMSLISAFLVYWLMQPRKLAVQHVRSASLGRGFATLLTNWRFWITLLFAAIPAKLILTGVLFFQVPLLLSELGSSQSEIGRIIMVYGVAGLLLTPLFAYWADRSNSHGVFVVMGGLITGAGMISMILGISPGQVLIATLALGIGQAMSIPSLFSLVTRVARRQIEMVGQASALGVFRLIERLGAAAGPFVVATLLQFHDHATVMGWLGAGSMIAAVLFGFIMLSFGYENEDDAALAV